MTHLGSGHDYFPSTTPPDLGHLFTTGKASRFECQGHALHRPPSVERAALEHELESSERSSRAAPPAQSRHSEHRELHSVAAI